MSLFGPPNVEKMTHNFAGLINALGYKKDPAIRIAACRALPDCRSTWDGTYEYGAAVHHLAAHATSDPDPDVRLTAIETLGRIYQPSDRTVIDHLGAIARTGVDKPAQRAALNALTECAAHFRDRPGHLYFPLVSDTLFSFGPAAVPALIDRLNNLASTGRTHTDKADERRSIITILTRFGSAAVEPLKKIIDTDSKTRDTGRISVVYSAIHTLGMIGTPEACDVLAELLDHEWYSDSANNALASAGDPRSAPYLVKLVRRLNPSSHEERMRLPSIIKQLSLTNSPLATEPLLHIAVNEYIYSDVQRAARDAIIRMGDPQAVTWLVVWLSSTSRTLDESLEAAQGLLDALLYVCIGAVSDEDLLAIVRLKDGPRAVNRVRRNQLDETEWYDAEASMNYSTLRDHVRRELERRGID